MKFFYCKMHALNILMLIFILSICKVSADTVYYIPEGSLGTAPSNNNNLHPSYAACIGSISNNLQDLYAQCYAAAPDGHIGKNQSQEFYGRIWNKLGMGRGSINAGLIRIPYELRNTRDNSLSTTYNDIVSYDSKVCPNEGCYITTFGEDDEPPTVCVGNPIDPATGQKLQTEIDLNNNLSFYRYYHSAEHSGVLGKSWFHSFDHSISFGSSKLIGGQREKLKSIPYNTIIDACVKGWGDIKKRLNASWALETVANYDSSSNTCFIKNGGAVVAKTYPINTNDVFADSKQWVQLHRANGSVLRFEEYNSGDWRSSSNNAGILSKRDDGVWQYVSQGGIVELYSVIGKLISVTYPGGTTLNLNYDNKRQLQSVISNQSQSIQFKYEIDLLSELTTSDLKIIKFSYDANFNLKTVRYPDSTSRTYHYEDTRFPTALTGITDERGARYATWTYDAQGRAISSEHAGGAEKTLLTFNADGSTTVTNALNKQTIYRFADIAGARRVTKVEGQPTANCAGANQDYTYTPQGWIASKTDWKGIQTRFTYNTAGQEISRTEAFGTPDARTITTEWHPTLFVKTKITEPEKETVYTYDANGRLLNQSTQSISAQ